MSKTKPVQKHDFQGDLLTGEWRAEPPKRGNGSHVRLKSLDVEKTAVPGMASYAGEGPANKYCKDCVFFGKVAVQRGVDDVEINRTGCVIYAQRMGHAAPTTKRDIRLSPACRHFVAGDDSRRQFIVDRAGAVHPVNKFPANLPRWRPNDEPSVVPDNSVIA
jgi:hypothetical protein